MTMNIEIPALKSKLAIIPMLITHSLLWDGKHGMQTTDGVTNTSCYSKLFMKDYLSAMALSENIA